MRPHMLIVIATLIFECVSSDPDIYLPLVELAEKDYEELCVKRSMNEWALLSGSENALDDRFNIEKTYWVVVERHLRDLQGIANDVTLDIKANPEFMRKIDLMTHMGDVHLPVEQWNKLVNTSVVRQYILETGDNEHPKLNELEERIRHEQDPNIVYQLKKSWNENLLDSNMFLEHILPLIHNATKANGQRNPQEYWNMLVELENGVSLARSKWLDIQSLYDNLQKYVGKRLRRHGRSINSDGSIPVQHLGSLHGDDWTAIAHIILPNKYHAILNEINMNIKGDATGYNAFQKADTLLEMLGLGRVSTNFWQNSNFNDDSCPPRIVSHCRSDVRVSACGKGHITDLADAVEILAEVRHREIAAEHNSFILTDPPRISPLYRGLAGSLSLLSWSPTILDEFSILPKSTYNNNPIKTKITIQMLQALRDLPKLNYMFCADDWRIRRLSGDKSESWSQYRNKCSGIHTDVNDYMGDYNILKNRPYLGDYLGVMLKYQVYRSFVEEVHNPDDMIVSHIRINNQRFINAMKEGHKTKWTELIPDVLGNTDSISAFQLLTHYETLNEFLKKQLRDPDDTADVDEFDSNDITHDENIENVKADNVIEPDIKGDFKESTINTVDEQSTANDNVDYAAYKPYMWIGIGLILAVLLLAIIIIAKKRHAHKKKLARDRKYVGRA